MSFSRKQVVKFPSEFLYVCFMKTLITCLMFALTVVTATSVSATSLSKPKPCGKYNGHNLYKGEKGGCYYLKTKKKIKTYVDKKHCNC